MKKTLKQGSDQWYVMINLCFEMLGSMYYFRIYKTYLLTTSYDKIMSNIFKCSQDTKGFSKNAIFNLRKIFREKSEKKLSIWLKLPKILFIKIYLWQYDVRRKLQVPDIYVAMSTSLRQRETIQMPFLAWIIKGT